MEEQARRAALRAVAKIALGAGYLASGGCGGKLESPSSSADPFVAPPNDSAITAVDANPGGEAGESLACLGSISTKGPASLVGDQALACCEAYVLAHPERPVDAGSHDPSLVNCCTAVVVRGRGDSKVRDVCCFGGILGPPEQVWRTINYCAPWGPPVPPALDWGAEEAT